MKVYVVYWWNEGDKEICKIFSSEKKAKRFISERGAFVYDRYDVKEVE